MALNKREVTAYAFPAIPRYVRSKTNVLRFDNTSGTTCNVWTRRPFHFMGKKKEKELSKCECAPGMIK